MKGNYYRGSIWNIKLEQGKDSEQGGDRPAVIIQNDIGNKYSPTVIVAMITSQIHKAKLPTHVQLKVGEGGISEDSIILCEQVRTISKERLVSYRGQLNEEIMENVDYALLVSLGMVNKIKQQNVI